jgi:ATP synthase protein I
MTLVIGRTIRTGLAVLGVLAVPTLVLAGVLRGGAGVAGAALGLVLVAAFFALSKLVVGAVARRAPAMLLPAAVSTYVAKIIILGGLLISLENTTVINLLAFAWSIFVGVLAWVGAELWVATHTRLPFFEPEIFDARKAGQNGKQLR